MFLFPVKKEYIEALSQNSFQDWTTDMLSGKVGTETAFIQAQLLHSDS